MRRPNTNAAARSGRMAAAILALSLATTSVAQAQYTAPSRTAGRVALRGNGALLAVAVYSGAPYANSVGLFSQQPGSTYWFAANLGFAAASRPIVITDPQDRALILARTFDGAMLAINEGAIDNPYMSYPEVVPRTQTDGAPMPPFTGEPTAVRNGDGSISMLAIAGGALWQSTRTPAGWSAWSALGRPPATTLVQSPVASLKNTPGAIVFAQGADRAVWSCEQLSVRGAWEPWRSLGGSVNTYSKGIGLGLQANGRVSVFLGNSSGTVSRMTQTNVAGPTTWPSAWTLLVPGPQPHGLSAPAVAPNYDRRLSLFFYSNYGSSNAPLYLSSQTSPSSVGWSPWTTAGRSSAPPAAIRDLRGLIHTMALGADGNLYEYVQASRNSSTYVQGLVGYGPLLF